ncbi:hypothetical protein HMPREF1032_03928 [Subdoligranulum sp. 4_3_54A2FAA]|nr:hypothetical protein HMPREF1032_03928 [Subdoligranulum sp. 4_3_54A2FAA]
MIGILPLIIKKTRPIYNRAGQKCGNNGPGGAGNLPRGFAAGEMEPVGSKRRGFAVGDPARRSRDGTAKERCGVAKPWPRSGQTAPGRFARRNAAPDFARQTQKVGPMTGQRGFAAGEMEPVGSKRRGFAVGDPARRSRDGDGKRAVRCDEAMAAKRTNRTGSFRAAKRRARFCAANPKGGADDRPARFRLRRNGAEWRQAPWFCRWGPGAAQP